MSFFKKGSIFNAVPAALQADQRAWLDGVRGTCEAAHLSFLRLTESLGNPALYAMEGKVDFPANELMTDAFSFVDASHRLRNLLCVLTKFFKVAPPGVDLKRLPTPVAYQNFKIARKVLESKLDGLVDIRDGTQHMDDKIKLLGDMGAPVWGILEWGAATPADEQTAYIHFCSITSGYIFTGSTSAVLDLDAPIGAYLNRIKLSAHGRKLDLTEIRAAMEKPIECIDSILKPQFDGLPKMPTNIYSRFVSKFSTAPKPSPELRPTGTDA